MNVSAVNGAYWLPTERENVKADKGNGFAETLATAKAKETEAGSVPTVCAPSYTISDEDAEYFREKYGEDYDEDQPYQIFYELAEKKIISSDDACNASEYGRLIFVFCDVANLDEFNKQVRSGAAKEFFSDYTCYGRYYDRFKGEYDKEINTWQDAAQKQLDFYQYLIDLDEELLTPDGTHFQSSKEQMNVSFRKTCSSIMKVKDVLSQIFG